MGTRIIPPFVPPLVDPGVSCSLCWGVGKPFGLGPTPDKVFLTFSGRNRTPGGNPDAADFENGLHELDQVPGTPCKYATVLTRGDLFVEWNPGFSRVSFRFGGFDPWFISFTLNTCVLFFPGDDNPLYENGSALITIPEVG